MRLFVASGIIHPESGGPATYLHTLLPALQARGWAVRVLAYSDDDVPPNTTPYPVQRVRRATLPLRLARFAAAAVPHLAWADVVYQHSALLPLPNVRRVPVVLKVVGDPAWERAVRVGWCPPSTDIDAFQGAAHPPRVALAAWERAQLAQRVHCVVTPSHYLARMVHGWGAPPQRVRVVHNALPHDHAEAAIPRAAARAALGLSTLPPGALLLLTVARLTAWKGVDALIRVLAQHPRVVLAVAGDGPERAALEALAAQHNVAGRVLFWGAIPRAQVALAMRAADAVALYSGYEGLSHVLLEALRAGTPVLASDKGGNPEVVSHGVNGLLVPYPDDAALSAAVAALHDPALRATLAAGAAAPLRAHFGFGHMVEATHTLLSAVAQGLPLPPADLDARDPHA